MGILNRHDCEQEAKEFLNQIEKNKAIVEQWGDIHYFVPEEVREIAGITEAELVARFIPAGSLEVIYYYVHLQRDKFEKPEQIFELSDLSKPMSEYYGSFRLEQEDVLINRFGIKRIMH